MRGLSELAESVSMSDRLDAEHRCEDYGRRYAHRYGTAVTQGDADDT